MSADFHIVFAGGGTGGHIYPLTCIAREVLDRVPSARVKFLTTDRAIDARVIGHVAAESPGDITMTPQSVRPLPRSIGDAVGFVPSWRSSVARCREMFESDRPACVIGSGGYGSAPAICAAYSLGIRNGLLNPDALPGKANRYLARRTETIFVQFAIAAAHLPMGADVRMSGCPVRPAFLRYERESGIEHFGLDPGRRTLVVTGASQGSRSINRSVVATLPHLRDMDTWQILHFCGLRDRADVQSGYRNAPIPTVVLEYTEQMGAALATADLVLSRAGASTLAELTTVGVPSVLMPYPHHRDRHQYANAQVLVDAGAAELVEDRIEPTDNVERLSAALTGIMGDAPRRQRMAQAACRLGCRDATSVIADWAIGRSSRGIGAPGNGAVAGIEASKPGETMRERVPVPPN